MSKILITGSTGFIGKRLVIYLLEEGHEVYAFVRRKGYINDNPNLKYIVGDLQNPDALKD